MCVCVCACCVVVLKVFGHSKVSVLEGGLKNWPKGAEVLPREMKVSDDSTGSFFFCSRLICCWIGITNACSSSFRDQGRFQVRKDQELVKSKYDILDNLDPNSKNKSQIVDARSEDRFFGRVDEPRADIPRGSIPESANVR